MYLLSLRTYFYIKHESNISYLIMNNTFFFILQYHIPFFRFSLLFHHVLLLLYMQ